MTVEVVFGFFCEGNMIKKRRKKEIIVKRSQLVLENPVIESRPASLVGAADFLKDKYVNEGTMARDQTLILSNPLTGEIDVSDGSLSKSWPRKHASKSKIADTKNRKRREKYRKVRDGRKSAKIPIVSQQVTETKSAS
jgi:hypothetical protein